MWKVGQLPVPAEQLPAGTILVKAAKSPTNAVGLYARVSSSDQKKDWEAQLGRLVAAVKVDVTIFDGRVVYQRH